MEANNIAATVVSILNDRGLHLATAESCTAGLLSAAITDVAGSSNVFDLGVTTYSNNNKGKFLEVEPEILEQYGAVSAQTAVRMSKGVLKLANQTNKTDIGIAVTGVAGPGQSENKPAGLVYISLADEDNVWVNELRIKGAHNNRDGVRRCTVKYALEMLISYLNKDPSFLAAATTVENPVSVLITDRLL